MATTANQPCVFIGQRRDDSGGWAGRLEDDLADRFGSRRVFRDIKFRAPRSVAQRHRSTVAVWTANQERISEYQQRLDAAGSRSQFAASIGYLASIRPNLRRDGAGVRAGLISLGGECKLGAPDSS